MLGACSLLGETLGTSSTSTSTPTTTKAKLKACSIEEATKKIQDGSAFTKGISVTADEISETCLKKLALEAAGLDTQATQDATSALQTLMNAASGLK